MLAYRAPGSSGAFAQLLRQQSASTAATPGKVLKGQPQQPSAAAASGSGKIGLTTRRVIPGMSPEMAAGNTGHHQYSSSAVYSI